ncbi:hypothetical protein PINS_up014037 [Pythium insidiosum]|nr:hypothetical protein PINS_up014037 [Pythium insidiosum]
MSGRHGNAAGKAASDPATFVATVKLSRSCLLLIIASHLASFTPHESDANFLASSGTIKRKRRAPKPSESQSHVGGASAKARKSINQLLVGPKTYTLTRLLAIHASLQTELDAGTEYEDQTVTRVRADVFTHLAILIRLRLLQRTSPPNDLEQLQFRSLADAQLVEEVARTLKFPLESYLTLRS